MHGTLEIDLTDMKILAREGKIEVGTGSKYGTITLQLSDGAKGQIKQWKGLEQERT